MSVWYSLLNTYSSDLWKTVAVLLKIYVYCAFSIHHKMKSTQWYILKRLKIVCAGYTLLNGTEVR